MKGESLMSTEAMFLVLSDLHFSRDLFEAPELPRLSLSERLRIVLKDAAVTNFFTSRCKGHDIGCVKILPVYLKGLLAQAQRHEFDLCILLGDQVTVPDSKAYAFLRKYLTQQEYRCSDGYIDYRCAGLGFNKEQILAIPGNHDKLLLTNLDFYNGQFRGPIELSEEVVAQRCAVSVRKFGSREFVFVLADANRYATKELHLDVSARNHLASGEITRLLEEDIVTKLRDLKNGSSIEHGLECFDTACKILLVHYPVEPGRFNQKMWDRGLPHGCEGLPEFVDKLRDEFRLNIVLHGHLHQPMLYNHEGVQVISATTSSQSGGQIGFYILNVSDTGQISTQHHSWNGAAFAADPPSSSLSRVITEFPTSAVA